MREGTVKAESLISFIVKGNTQLNIPGRQTCGITPTLGCNIKSIKIVNNKHEDMGK